MSADLASMSHLTNDELAAYLDQRLDAASTAALESHMADCAECRADLVATRRLLAGASPLSIPSHWNWAALRGAWIAAAGIAAIALVPLLHRAIRPDSGPPPTRAARTSAGAIEVIAPPDRTIGAESLVFTWRAVAGASTYRLTVTDSTGGPLLSLVTADTSFTPLARNALARGGAYLWYVDCLTSDGRTLSSRIHSFSVSR